MMMFYRRRASPKHRYDMTEVDYGGGGHRTRLRDQEINCCVYGVPPAPVYKGAREEEVGPHRARPKCGVLLGLPSPSRIPPPILNRKRGREKEKEGRGRPPSLVQFGPEGGARLLPFGLSPLFPYGPIRPIYSEKYPNHSEPFRCPNIVVQYIDLYVSTI